MGVEPNVFEPNIENTIKYIHPDDLDYVTKVHLDSLLNHQPTSMIFRFLTPNGDVKYIMGVGSFTTNSNGDLIKIGVNYDITDQYQKTLELENNNKELKYINTELEAFNNIVSHDLQEPLRKIQTFISRINEKEKDNLSESGKQYMERIVVAASRMRVLIDDLLQYSRTNKTDASFEDVNLDEIALASIQELSELIEETKATVTFSELPTVKGIPFQFRQLFINLINNSIKYRKLNQPPIITVTYEKIKASEDDQIDDNSNRIYHKITFLDNGIGFHPDDSKKIFLLFNRLHAKESYPGTGVGLAICKKIVKNHYGFICANGQPEEGAQIVVYLPTEY